MAYRYLLFMNGTNQQRAEVRKYIGRQLRSARERAGLTQQQLADAIGLQQSEISNIERGHRSFPSDRATAVAKACDVSIAYLFPPISTPSVTGP